MYVSGVTETFTITQRDMIVAPTYDRVCVRDLEWNSYVKFDSDSDIVNNPTTFNITNEYWINSEVFVYRDGEIFATENAEASGLITYNYTDTYLGSREFEFRISIIPTPLLFSIFLLLIVIAITLSVYSVLIIDAMNFTHIISGFLSGVVWMILGYQAYIGIGFEHTIQDSVYSCGVLLYSEDVVEVSSYQYDWVGMLFIMFGVVMILYNIVQVYNANKDVIKELEGGKDDY